MDWLSHWNDKPNPLAGPSLPPISNVAFELPHLFTRGITSENRVYRDFHFGSRLTRGPRSVRGQASSACPGGTATINRDPSFARLAIAGGCLCLLEIGLCLSTRVGVKRCQVIEQRLSSTQLRTT